MTAGSQRPEGGGNGAVRVTLISTLPPHKGVADYTAHLVAGLASTPGVSLEVIDFASLYPRRLYPGGELQDSTARRPQFPNVRVRTMLRWWNPFSWLWAGLTLKGQVVHAQWWSFILAPQYIAVLSLARLRRRRVVITVHNVEPHEAGRWQRVLNRLVLRLADTYVVHDARSRDRLAELVPAAKPIEVIPLGILASPGDRLSLAGARRVLRMAADDKIVLCFGNIRPYKGVDVLLQAFARVRERVPEARLVIAGKPWEDWSRYERLIDDLDLVDVVDTHLGFVPATQVGALFAAADVVALPYLRFDAQSAVGASALYHEKALVVTDAGGLPELVADERAVVSPGNVEQLAAALVAVLTDGAFRAKLEAGSAALARDLSWDAIAAQTARLYASLADRSVRDAPLPLAEERPRQEEHV